MGFCDSTLGKKYIMAITGLIWVGFVFTHMAANLLIIFSPEAYNTYTYTLTSNKPLLYGAEAVLVLSMVIHVITAIQLTLRNKASRNTAYAMTSNGDKGVSLASKTMIYQGALILAFLVYHLITFKYGPYYEVTYDGVVMRDMHRLVTEVFSSPGYVVLYLFSLVLVGVHLSHGFSSLFQSWGLNHPKYTPLIEKAGVAYAVVVALGFMSQPIYVILN